MPSRRPPRRVASACELDGDSPSNIGRRSTTPREDLAPDAVGSDDAEKDVLRADVRVPQGFGLAERMFEGALGPRREAQMARGT
jgi:hypothetical protein